jgi:phage/plasmid primase-like uncharacterized protein
MNDPMQGFMAAAAAFGLHFGEAPIPDGAWHRFPVADDRNGKKSGFYVCHALGSHIVGTFGDWRSGSLDTWRSFQTDEVDAKTLESLNRQMREHKSMHAAERLRKQQEAIAEIAEVRKRARVFEPEAATAELPYLAGKGFERCPSEVWVDRGSLLLPVHDAGGQVVNLQRIYLDRDGQIQKRWYPGAMREECWMAVPGKDPWGQGPIAIAEGYATAASMALASGFWTLAAGGADSLEGVARKVRELHPTVPLIIVADDDFQRPDNPGLTKARSAAALASATLLVPQFGEDRADGDTDLNDQHRRYGIASVKATIDKMVMTGEQPATPAMQAAARLAAMQPRAPWLPGEEPEFALRPVQVWSRETVDGPSGRRLPPKEPEPLLHANITGMLFGPPDAGKTHVAVRLAVCVAAGGDWVVARGDGSIGGTPTGVTTTWFVKPAETGCVLWLSAEENAEEMNRRLRAACLKNADGTTPDASERRRRLDAVARRVRVIAIHDTEAEGERLVRTVTRRDQATGDSWVDTQQLPLWGVVNDTLSRPGPDGSPWRLVVLDPAVELLGVADENSSPAMAAACREGIHSLRRRRDVTILTLHHSRKGKFNTKEDAADSVRGSSALIGSMRWAAGISSEGEKATIRVAKGNYIKKRTAVSLFWSREGDAWLGSSENEPSVPTEPRPTRGAEASPATASRDGGSEPYDAGPSTSDDFLD